MNVATRFNTLVCTTVLLGILMFCLADGRPGLAAISALMCFLGWLAGRADGGWTPLALPRLLVNLLVLAAIFNAALQASGSRFGDPIVSHLGEFLVYVQILKLFDRRSTRDESQLLTLSVFVVIAAMLTSNTLPVGICLLVYTPMAVASTMLYQLRSGQRRAAAPRPAAAPDPAGHAAAARARRAAMQFRRVMNVSLAGACGLAAVVFILTPRGMGQGALGNFGSGRIAQTGFNENITLGHSGYLGDDDTPVLDLAVTDSGGASLGSTDRVFYLRGITRTRYSGGAWEGGGRSEGILTTHPDRLEPVSPGNESAAAGAVAIQKITLRRANADSQVLFSLWRPLSISTSRPATVTVRPNDLVMRRRNAPPTEFTYLVESSLSDGGSEREPRRPVSFQSGPIRDLAVQVLENAGLPIDPDLRDRPMNRQAAAAIRDHLQSTCTYTREMIAPEEGQDPIEMFLFSTKRGHCEYFASAMVAMCQSVGIPARLVIGYVAADYNAVTEKYLVRQSNAHAWAEIHVGGGSWQTFDPSPPGDVAALHRPRGGWLSALRRWYDTLEFGWNRSIIGFDATSQTQAVGRRVNFEHLSSRYDDLTGRLFVFLKKMGRPDSSGGMIFRALPALVLVCVVALLVVKRTGSVRRSKRRRRHGRRVDVPAADAEFYRRALRLLDRAGVAKPETAPPLAHAEHLATTGHPAAGPLSSLASLYYKIRFAGQSLTREERAAAGDELARLRESLHGPPSAR